MRKLFEQAVQGISDRMALHSLHRPAAGDVYL